MNLDDAGLTREAYVALGGIFTMCMVALKVWKSASATQTEVHGKTKERQLLDRMEDEYARQEERLRRVELERDEARARAERSEAQHVIDVTKIATLESKSDKQQREILHLRAEVAAIKQWLMKLADKNPTLAPDLIRVLEVDRYRKVEDPESKY